MLAMRRCFDVAVNCSLLMEEFEGFMRHNACFWVFGDSTAALQQVSSELAPSFRRSHISIKGTSLREAHLRQEIGFKYVPTICHWADAMTNIFPSKAFEAQKECWGMTKLAETAVAFAQAPALALAAACMHASLDHHHNHHHDCYYDHLPQASCFPAETSAPEKEKEVIVDFRGQEPQQ